MAFDRIQAQGPEALFFLGPWSICSGRPETLVSTGMRQDRISISGHRPPDLISTPIERMDIGLVTQEILFDTARRCFLVPEVTAERVVVMGADRSRAHIGSISFGIMDPDILSASGFIALDDVLFVLPDGMPAASVSSVSVSLDLSPGEISALDPGSLMSAVRDGHSSIAVEVSGALVPVRDILNGVLPRSSGGSPDLPESIPLDLSFNLDQDAASVDVTLDIVSPGMFSARGDVSLGILEDQGVPSIPALQGLPAGAEIVPILSRLSIARASLSLEDERAIDIAETLWGFDRKDIPGAVKASTGMIPSTLRDILVDAAEKALQGNVRIEVAPSSPVTPLQVLVATLMNPARSVSLLGLSVE